MMNNHRRLTTTLESHRREMSNLQANDQQLLEKKNQKFSSIRKCEYHHSEAYGVHLKNLSEAYEKADQEVRELSNISDAMKTCSQLKERISNLERQSQVNCDCGTDHKCSGYCQICSIEVQTESKSCMFRAGHTGEHKCDAGHVCKQLCQICQLRGDKPNQCHFPYKHQDPVHHQCERVHSCPRTCEVCSEPCSIPFDFEGHQRHQCQSKVRCKSCMFSCGRICATKYCDHDWYTDEVKFTKDEKTVSMKKHLCDQPHRCLGICDTPGVCKLSHYTVEKRNWTTESSETFTYDRIEVSATRNKCEEMIDAGLYSHTATIQMHQCKAQHTCDQRCPDCNAFCRQPYGHPGYHSTLHRNKDQHVFTSTNPSEAVEIRSGDSSTSIIRKYKIGDSAESDSCSVFCKRRGRGHFHLIECPGENDCYGRKLATKARHSNEVYYYGIHQPVLKKYDEILCSAYWSEQKWSSPVNDTDRKLIESCDFYCNEHVRRDKGQIIQDSPRGFCGLDAWHTELHTFECTNVHQTVEKYQGLDICFVIDTTMSMTPYIEKVKLTIKRIIEENEAMLKKIKASGTFQFGIVDYRDHEPEGDYVFRQCQFTSHESAIKYIEQLKADSGGDTPEAVLDGLEAACDLKWRDQADHLLFHVLDAPPHGKMYGTFKDDRWPKGCPCGKKAEGVLSNMKKKNISYHVLPCSQILNMMIREFKKFIDVKVLSFDDKISFEDIITRQIHQQLCDTEMTIKRSSDLVPYVGHKQRHNS